MFHRFSIGFQSAFDRFPIVFDCGRGRGQARGRERGGDDDDDGDEDIKYDGDDDGDDDGDADDDDGGDSGTDDGGGGDDGDDDEDIKYDDGDADVRSDYTDGLIIQYSQRAENRVYDIRMWLSGVSLMESPVYGYH